MQCKHTLMTQKECSNDYKWLQKHKLRVKFLGFSSIFGIKWHNVLRCYVAYHRKIHFKIMNSSLLRKRTQPWLLSLHWSLCVPWAAEPFSRISHSSRLHQLPCRGDERGGVSYVWIQSNNGIKFLDSHTQQQSIFSACMQCYLWWLCRHYDLYVMQYFHGISVKCMTVLCRCTVVRIAWLSWHA